MSLLTEEQKKRMEENRRKALERRAAAAGNNVTNCGNSFSKIVNNEVSQSTTSNVHRLTVNGVSNCGSDRTFGNSFYGNGSPKKEVANIVDLKENKINKNNTENLVKTNYCFPIKNYGSQTSFSGGSSKSGYSGGTKTLTGTCALSSKERFYVQIGYHAQVLEVFKTMESRAYDAIMRCWNFSLNDHDKLMSAVNVLRPSVVINPLPSFVRKALQRSKCYTPLSAIDLSTLEPTLLDALHPFQHEGVCFGISRCGRVLIADDMGLGKTIQALGVALYYKQEWPLLVVAPSSMRYSWVNSFEKWVPSMPRSDIVVVESAKQNIDDAQVIIISYDLLVKKVKEIHEVHVNVVIMDESHMLKSFKTARYKAADLIMKKAKRIILLSGTPVLSRPNELYTQVSGIDHKLFPLFQDFGIRYCDGKQQPWGWDFSGSSNMDELQVILEATTMIRRLKSDVIKQLPAKQRVTVILDPSSVQTKDKLMKDAADNFGLQNRKGLDRHGALLQFFHQSAFAKLKAVSQYVKELVECDEKFLVFAHHQVMLDTLCDTCHDAKCKFIKIDGSTNSEKRQQLVDQFQKSPDVKVAVLSITAANSGITLTAAHLVVMAELYWNPGILMQAEDRVHRIGQEDSVLVKYLVAKGTSDDYIWPMVQSKLDVLKKAGLTKDNFSEAGTVFQSTKEEESILKYLIDTSATWEEPDEGSVREPIDGHVAKKLKL